MGEKLTDRERSLLEIAYKFWASSADVMQGINDVELFETIEAAAIAQLPETRIADEAERVIGELEATNEEREEYVLVLEADRKLLHRLIATMRRGEDETMEDTIEGIETLHGEVDGLKSRLAAMTAAIANAQSVDGGVREQNMKKKKTTGAWWASAYMHLLSTIKDIELSENAILSPSFTCPGCAALKARINDDGSLETFDDHLGILDDAMAALNKISGDYECPSCAAKDRQLERAREAWEEIREDYLIGVSWPDPQASKMDTALKAKTFDNPSGVYDAALATKEEGDTADPPKGRVIAEVDDEICTSSGGRGWILTFPVPTDCDYRGAVLITVREREEG